jgi:hypothetical protein
MSPIAEAMFHVLRIRTPKPVPRRACIDYSELVAEIFRYPEVPPDLDHHDDARVNDAIRELIEGCRAQNLPNIAALVMNERTHQPIALVQTELYGGEGEAALAKWEAEMKEVAMTFYPQGLD